VSLGDTCHSQSRCHGQTNVVGYEEHDERSWKCRKMCLYSDFGFIFMTYVNLESLTLSHFDIKLHKIFLNIFACPESSLQELSRDINNIFF